MKKTIEATGLLAIDYSVREWCRFPYPGHPDGCPNYGNKDTCPPKAPLVEEFFNLTYLHYFVIVSFDLAGHVERMREKHPDWSDRQLRCCLYWQGTVRKELTAAAKEQADAMAGVYTLIPEAMGVNVFRSLHRLGIKIRKNPRDEVLKVALVGVPKMEVEKV